MQQLWTDQRIQAMGQRKADVLVMLKRSTNHLSQLATQRLEQNLDDVPEILQQKRDEVKEASHPANDQEGATSSIDETSSATTDDEITQIDFEIDDYEFDYEAIILPPNIIELNSNSPETAVEDGIETDNETLKATESEDWIEFEDFDDEGLFSLGG